MEMFVRFKQNRKHNIEMHLLYCFPGIESIDTKMSALDRAESMLKTHIWSSF